jgi:7-carboxy-7-deazaguanine synthase
MSDTLVINEIYLSLQGESTFAGLPCIFVRLAACNLRCSYCDTAYAFTQGTKQSLEEILMEVRRLAAPFADQPTICPRHLDGTAKVAALESAGRPSALAPSLRPSTVSPLALPFRLPLVELTGGEPLLQNNCIKLMESLCDEGFTVLLETSGAHDIGPVDPRVRRIMDLKCPSSGEAARNRWENLAHLKSTDEIKFVIGTEVDYAWMKEAIAQHGLDGICPLLVSWVHPLAPEQQDKSLKPVPEGQTAISRQALAERIIADALPVRFQIQMHKVIWSPAQRGV